MEDSHTTVLDLLANVEPSKAHPQKLSFFGVFDGHGGSNVALYAGDNIHKIIAKQDTFKAGNYEQALKDGFLATDRAILSGMRILFRTARAALLLRAPCPIVARTERTSWTTPLKLTIVIKIQIRRWRTRCLDAQPASA